MPAEAPVHAVRNDEIIVVDAEAAASARFARRALEQGLILNWTLHRDTVVRLAPPLVLSDAEAELALEGIASLSARHFGTDD